MPLTQARMMAVLDDYDALRDQFLRLKSDLQGAIAFEQQSGDNDKSTALTLLATLLEQYPEPAGRNAAVERYHFKKFARRNEHEKRRMTKRRRIAGMVEKIADSAPDGEPKDVRPIPAIGRGALAASIEPDSDNAKPEDFTAEAFTEEE